jgi:hypothetical protein
MSRPDFEAMVRVMIRGAKPDEIRSRLEWFYRFQGVTRPQDRAEPSNVVRLGERRARRNIERDYGPVIAATILASVRRQEAAMVAVALRLEAEMDMLERIAARKAKKARK